MKQVSVKFMELIISFCLYFSFCRVIFSFFRVFYFFGVFQYSFFPNKKSADSFRTSHIAENVSSEGSAFP